MYEWDENKNNSNEIKHGLRFELAIEVFSDPRAVIQPNRKINGSVAKLFATSNLDVII